MIELDEIGRQIVKNKYTAAFKAMGWQVDRSWKVSSSFSEGKIDKEKLGNIEKSDYFEFSEANDTVCLSSSKWTIKKTLREKMMLNQYLLQKNIGFRDVLWPLSIVKKLTEPKCSGGLKIRIQLPEDLLIGLYKNKFKQLKIDYIFFRNQVYMKMLQQFASHRWLLTYLTGATPFEGSATRPVRSQSECYAPTITRLADQVLYHSLKDYLKSDYCKQAKLVDGVTVGSSLDTENEMLEKGIHYLEITHLDLDPFSTLGISNEIMDLLEAMAAFFIATPGIRNENLQKILKEKRQLNQQIAHKNPFAISKCQVQARQFINKLSRFVSEAGLSELENSLNKIAVLCSSPTETPSTKLLRGQGSEKIDASALRLALDIKGKNINALAGIVGKLDSNSWLVLCSAFKLGESFSIVSLPDKLIKVGDTMLEAGIQTEKNSGIMQKLWANRELSKEIVAAAGYSIPTGWIISSIAEAENVYQEVQGLLIAIKNSHLPGVCVFRVPPTRGAFLQTVKKYLTPEYPCIVEQVVVGSNYTALIVGGKVISLVERIPQNVVGDGRSSIEKLIQNKRAKRKSLQSNFEFGKFQIATLAEQGRTSKDILPRGVQLYLRYDASTGTGADYFEALTEANRSCLGKIEQLAKILKMNDGGLDVIISNIYQTPNGEDNQFVFLNAHASPCFSEHELTLLGKTQHPADYIVKNAIGLNEHTK
ncbi:hypothetical protein [Liquorilactobacillus uvarum]|uniref:hypothetical protein n=2 Tax=Liquorilactobacillus uvarum TaxID=303240 RepID=UPI0028895917|nr:hypothetical protein [Liquorilactobacillus uvarum]